MPQTLQVTMEQQQALMRMTPQQQQAYILQIQREQMNVRPQTEPVASSRPMSMAQVSCGGRTTIDLAQLRSEYVRAKAELSAGVMNGKPERRCLLMMDVPGLQESLERGVATETTSLYFLTMLVRSVQETRNHVEYLSRFVPGDAESLKRLIENRMQKGTLARMLEDVADNLMFPEYAQQGQNFMIASKQPDFSRYMVQMQALVPDLRRKLCDVVKRLRSTMGKEGWKNFKRDYLTLEKDLDDVCRESGNASGGLSTAATVAIVVGCLLLLLVAVGVFLHFHQPGEMDMPNPNTISAIDSEFGSIDL